MRRRGVLGAGLVLAVVGIWEAAVHLTNTPAYLLPAPSQIASVLSSDAAGLVPAAAITLGEALGGLAIGGAVGLALAVAITFWDHLEQGVMALALLIKSTPVIAVAPILTIWMGFGTGPKVVVTALLTFFPVLINALEGFRSVPSAISDWMRSIDAPDRQVFLHARWPSARPYLFAALRVAAPSP